MLKDDELYPMPLPRGSIADAEEVIHEQYANNELDDVFGSAPPSPTFYIDDETPDDRNSRGNVELSDIRHIKTKHETEGYRDGVTTGKSKTVQEGFDEGYSLGAVLGLRIGKLLGVLEGIYGALGGEDNREERERTKVLWDKAEKELATQHIYGKEWWGEDGIWTFEVEGEGEGKEVTFHDVAQSHPLVKLWTAAVKLEVERWGLNMSIMEGENIHGEEPEGEGKISTEKKQTVGGKEAVAEPVTATGMVLGVQKKDLNW